MHRAQPVAHDRTSKFLRALILGGFAVAVTAGCAHRAGTAVSPVPGLSSDPYANLQPEERVTVYQESLQVKPDNAIIHFRLGNAYYDLKQLSRAVEEYQAAVKLDSTLAPAWGNLGTALQEQDDLSGALNAYQKAVTLTPKDAAAWSNLGSVQYAKGQHQAAADSYVRALRIDPRNVQALYNMGVAFADAQIYHEVLNKAA